MHLIFERSDGRFKSNCNILALAWMPYYVEIKFRQALFDYHQKQLINLTSSHGCRTSTTPEPNSNNHGHSSNRNSSSRQNQVNGSINNNISEQVGQNHAQQLVNNQQFLNSRIAELYQRYIYMKYGHQKAHSNHGAKKIYLYKHSNALASNELDIKYGRMPEFGWLVVGNVGKIVGVTLTSIVQPPEEIDRHQINRENNEQEADLMVFKEENANTTERNVVDAKDGQSRNSQRKPVQSSAEFEQLRPDKKSLRSNYNLRGHLDEVILVRWNELYQKLATIDSKGNVLIWCKVNEKFTIQTPFYNRTKSVADFKWSNDGKTALICYTDSFILIGSSSGQRHWHSMLNLDDYHITCASWTPNDEQLLLGVSNGNVVVIDLPQSELTELVVSQVNIRTICWSSYEMNLNHINKLFQLDRGEQSRRSSSYSGSYGRNSTIVNHRRLSRDCSVFSRYRFCSQGPNNAATTNSTSIPNGSTNSLNDGRFGLPTQTNSSETSRQLVESCYDDQRNILAIDFANNTIKLYNGGLDDPEPRCIKVNLESYIMAWSSDGKVLAVAGFNIFTSAPTIGCLRCRYSNSIKFYDQQGGLIYEHTMKYSRYPITAFTWAHDGQRLFVATGPRLHCAKVYFGVASLSLLALSCFQRHTRIPDKTDVLDGLLKGQFNPNVLNWQSFNCPIDINRESLTKSNSLISSSDRSPSLTDASANDLDGQFKIVNNTNILKYELPTKLKIKIDELFAQTIRQPFDEQLSLNDIAWHVPKSQQRYYCTLVCYTNDLMDRDIGAIGHQYRTGLIDRASDTSDQYKIFVLYVEFQGSLIPILRARRIGFLKPEFVIFDPEESPNKSVQRHHKVSDISHHLYLSDFIDRNQHNQQQQADLSQTIPNSAPFECSSGFAENCSELHSYSEPMTSSVSLGRQSLSDAEHYYNFDQCDTVNRQQNQDSRLTNLGKRPNNSMFSDPYLYLLNVGQQKSIYRHQTAKTSTFTTPLIEMSRALERYKSAMTAKPCSNSVRTLPETNELVRIRSNIWGTRFKVINVGNRMIRQRAILGSVIYKASILHLQPRQIFLSIKDMSNYCILCSSHHHSKLASQKLTSTGCNIINYTTSLIDMPNDELKSVATPKISKHSKCRPSRRTGSDDNKVVIPVGDSIKIAPKLERNQKYKLCNGQNLLLDHQRPSTSKGFNGSPSTLSTRRDNSRHKHQGAGGTKPLRANSSMFTPLRRNIHQLTSSETHSNRLTDFNNSHDIASNTYRQSNSNQSTSNLLPCNSNNQQLDDILTLSLDQGDKVRVEMSSLNTIEASCNSQNTVPTNPELTEFLEANKTLKSIQTITKMIVDLSSKADIDVSDSNSNTEMEPKAESECSSPSKILKSSEGKPSASRYVPPETPVHRPRKPRAIRETNLKQIQSATTTPMKVPRRQRRQTTETNDLAILTNPLPPPPPSVPISKRLSSSAKRFIDGSLRTLYGGSGYSTCDDLEPEEYEPLVAGREMSISHRHRRRRRHRQDDEQTSGRSLRLGQSQPCTPLKQVWLPTGRKSSVDFASLREHLVQKLRSSTNWRGSDDGDNIEKSSSAKLGKLTNNDIRKSRGWMSSASSKVPNPTSNNYLEDDLVNSKYSSAVASSSSSLSSSEFSSSGDELDLEASHRFKRCDDKAKKPSNGCSSSAKNLNDLDKLDLTMPKIRRKQAIVRDRRRHRRKSICQNSSCCCAKEIKLNNRPPVWNELSQVYQLDFGGRVTQESAKNLQIDFDGNLVSVACEGTTKLARVACSGYSVDFF